LQKWIRIANGFGCQNGKYRSKLIGEVLEKITTKLGTDDVKPRDLEYGGQRKPERSSVERARRRPAQTRRL